MQICEARTTTKEHGRLVERHLEVSQRCLPHLSWPGLAQVCRLTRTIHAGDEKTVEVQYAITSLSADRADPAALLKLWRDHWGIENRVHWVRDTLWQEDRCRVKNPRCGHNLAIFRNIANNLLRLAKVSNLTATIRQNAYRVDCLLARLGIMKN